MPPCASTTRSWFNLCRIISPISNVFSPNWSFMDPILLSLRSQKVIFRWIFSITRKSWAFPTLKFPFFHDCKNPADIHIKAHKNNLTCDVCVYDLQHISCVPQKQWFSSSQPIALGALHTEFISTRVCLIWSEMTGRATSEVASNHYRWNTATFTPQNNKKR